MSILVVDDDVQITNLVAGMLQSEGYKVFVVSEVGQAMAVFEAAGDVELVISDAVMPGISGPELVDHLIREHSEVKVLFMSGLDRLSVLVAFAGACEWIQKPFSAADLKSKVRGMMQGQASKRRPASAGTPS